MKMLMCMLVLCLWSGVRAQFEGEIDMKITANEGGQSRETNISMLIRNELMSARMNSEGAPVRAARIILRGDRKLVWIIDDRRKVVIERSLEANQQPDSMKHEESTSKPNIRKTGKTETLLGYPCEEWVVTGEEGETSVWCNSKLGDLYKGFSKSLGEIGKMRMRRSTPDWRDDFIDRNLFPLKAVTTKDGKVKSTQEVTKIEQKKIAGQVFEFPEDYKKESFNMDINKTMDQMRDMMRQHMQQKNKKDDKKDENN
jgi:hypothetical protein